MPQVFHSTHSTTLSAPSGSYIYDLVPTLSPSGALAATASDDSLRIFDPSALALKNVVENIHNGVTVVRNVEVNVLATAGRDGIVRLWDVRVGGGKDVGRFGKMNSVPLLSLAVNAGANVIAAGTELVNPGRGTSVKIWDLRNSTLKVQYTESHNDDITVLHFHPHLPHLLLSGSTDSLVSVYNLLTPPSTSSATADDDVDEALHQVINHGSSIHRANFLFPAAGEKPDIAAISHDENLAIHRFFKEIPDDEANSREAEKKSFGDVRATLGCEYVVDVVPHIDRGGVVIAGSCSGRWVNLVSLRKSGAGMESWGFEEGVRLEGAHGEEVVRGVWVHEASGTVFTGGEDGLVKAWRNPDGEDAEAAPASTPGKAQRKRKKGREGEKETKSRYKPY